MVTPAQALLVVVPLKGHLDVEATVPTVTPASCLRGQDAEIKVDTFNFTWHGLLRGRVQGLNRRNHARQTRRGFLP